MSVLYNLSCKTLAQESERSKFSIAHFVVELARNSVASNRPPPMVAHSSPIATTAVDAKGHAARERPRQQPGLNNQQPPGL